jgi:hypothetical protein
MGNAERSGSGDPSDWPVRLVTMAGAGAGAAIALLWRPNFIGGFWPRLIGFVIFTTVGASSGGSWAGCCSGRRPAARRVIRPAPELA